MAREVRITVDDDEVFERMKTRKRELDLSWEEVLHRGLRRDESPPGGQAGPGGPGGSSHSVEVDLGHGARVGERGPPREPDPFESGDSIGEVVDEFKDHIRGQVQESLRASMESMDAADRGLEREMSELEEAEDAVLRFDAVTGEERRYDVPLRVRLETSRSGMDVDVVAVREGKSVADANSFDSETRRRINEHLARGGTAMLAFDGNESYAVGPVLTWSHDDDGRPTVTAVDIEEVVFDDAA